MSESTTLSRRRLLEAAGGITFLALAPNGQGAFAATLAPAESDPQMAGAGMPGPLPVFTALPYLQPGANGGPLIDGAESIVIAWQTNYQPAEFAVTVEGEATVGAPVRTMRQTGTDDGEKRYNYAVTIGGLKIGAKRYQYRVTMNGQRLAEGYFTTRKKRGQAVRFVAFGDNSFGEVSDRMIAYQTYQARPDFVMNTGDNVYESGLDDEYARYFFPVYNADVAGPRVGAPLLRSIPFYTVIANHDVHDKGPVADFDRNPDALGYYTAMHLPLNGPATPPHPTPTVGDAAILDIFHQAAGARFPRMANYSYDYGDAHFTCLDANVYIDPTDPTLQAWVEADLRAAADAPWKFVVFHHPSFNVGEEHYTEQHMRALSPLFERMGVAMVLHGHEHTYQRTRPFTFAPTDLTGAKAVNSKKRLVPGTFEIDREFDGVTKTQPKGIVYLTTGAGGKHLYDPDMNQNPARWQHPEDGNADYMARFVSDRHSLTVFDMDAHSLTLRQIDQWGNEIDRCRFTR